MKYSSKTLNTIYIQSWAEETNNLKLNCAKSCRDPKQRRQHNDPPPIPGILRRQKLQMLGVGIILDIFLFCFYA